MLTLLFRAYGADTLRQYSKEPKNVTAFDLFIFLHADLIQSEASWKLSSTSDFGTFESYREEEEVYCHWWWQWTNIWQKLVVFCIMRAVSFIQYYKSVTKSYSTFYVFTCHKYRSVHATLTKTNKSAKKQKSTIA